MFRSSVFTLPWDYSHVSFQRPLMTNESHLVKQAPIMMRLNPSLAQQSSHHSVNLQKQYKTYFRLTMTSVESHFFSHTFTVVLKEYIYFPDPYKQNTGTRAKFEYR